MMHQHRITLGESLEGWAVWCDDLPGCASQGATRGEALENIRSAIQDYYAAQEEIEQRFQTKVFHELVEV